MDRVSVNLINIWGFGVLIFGCSSDLRMKEDGKKKEKRKNQ